MTKTLFEKLVEAGASMEEAAIYTIQKKTWETIFHEAIKDGNSIYSAAAKADEIVYGK